MPRHYKKGNAVKMKQKNQEIISNIQGSPKELDSFFTNLQILYRNQQFCDITFTLDNLEFKAHKIIIASSNNFLSGMLMSRMQESELTVINISDDPNLFKFILDYLYGFTIEVPSSDVMPLLSLANSYSMICFRDQLLRILQSNLSIENCCALFAAAEDYGSEELRVAAQEIIFQNLGQVSATAAFLDLPQLLIERVLESDELLDTNESKIFNAAVIWLQHNLQQQKQLQLQSLQQQELSTSESQVTTSNKSGRGLSGRASRNPAKSSGSITGSTNNNQHSSNEQSLINAVLQHVRLPLIDCFVLSNQIKTHSFMRSPDQISRLLQAFELYCLRATGHIGNTCNLAQPRRKSCDLTLGLSIRAGEINGGHQDAVSALVMYKDTLISGSWDKTIKIWSTETWACLQTISNYASIRGLCICSDNLISCAEDGVVNVWQFVEDESHLGEFSGWELLHSLAGSESGTGVNVVIECEGRLACGVDDGTISLWNTDTWTKDLTIRHIGIDENDELNEEIEVGVMCLAVHDGKLVSSGDDSTIRIWCTRTWTCEHVLHTGEVWSISFTPLGNMVVGSVDDYLAVWHQVVETPTRSQTHVYRPDMNVNSNSHNTTRNVKTEWKLNQKVAGQKPVYATCYFNGCIISAGQGAADDHDNTISCWKARRQYGNPAAIETLELLCDFGIGEEDVWSLAVCDGKLVSGEANGCIRIWA